MIPSSVDVSWIDAVTPSLFSRLSSLGRGVGAACALVLIASLALAPSARAQHPLYLADDETTVRDLSWRFLGSRTFEADRLQNQIATKAPGSFHRLQRWFRWIPGVRPGTYPFDPITLQKDVVRIRQFYNQNGFLQPRVDYPTSQYDSTSNTIHVIFTVREGPPLIIQDAGFFQSDSTGYAVNLFEGNERERWINFRDRTAFEVGERYTEFNRIRIEDAVGAWLRDQGFAFASVTSEARIDSTANTADIRFFLDPGPHARIADIQIEGNRSVNDRVVRRELPFREGDTFSASKVTQGQRELFGLNLFRVAVADVPDQPRDSTVVVRYRVRETKLRTVSGQLGYGAQTGITLESNWTHRNFYGSARNLNVGLLANTGYPQDASFLPKVLRGGSNQTRAERTFRLSTLLRQPYVFSTRTSASISPFVLEKRSNKLADSDRFLGLNERQYGLETTLTYEFLPFRTLSLQHEFSRTKQFTARQPNEDDAPTGRLAETDQFDRSILSLSATLGRTDDVINPTSGFLVRPSAQIGGSVLGSDVQFARLSNEISAYVPLTPRIDLAGRAFVGILWPRGTSFDALSAPATDSLNAVFENRFDDFLFYAGGGTDVRGWPVEQAGAKFLRDAEGPIDYVYEPAGARSKIGVNLEVRLPFPGLGGDWRTAVFLDAARLDAGSLTLAPSPFWAPEVVPSPADSLAPIASTLGGALGNWRVGTGAGIRYSTPVGYLRVDLAMKLNPDDLDLRRPDDVADAVIVTDGERADDNPDNDVARPFTSVEERFIRRFRLHFGIGRTF